MTGRAINWVELRDKSGKLLARLEPERRLLEFQRRGELTLVDLARYLEDPERPTAA